MSLDLFIILLIPPLVYGFFQSIWEQSRTTFVVITGLFLIAFSAKYIHMDYVLLETYIFLLFLFVRAVFREKLKHLKNPILRCLFYA